MKLDKTQCLLVLTNVDLYPRPSWNFVFGLTSSAQRICVQSYARHHPDFYDNYELDYNQKIENLLTYRFLKTCCHELGHMFGLKHCLTYWCIMNGSHDPEEAYVKPFVLCPCCLRKTSHYFKLDEISDVKKRNTAVIKQFQEIKSQ